MYAATDPSGSRRVSGRYHRAADMFSPASTSTSADVWEALYLALAPETCLGEMLRHLAPEVLPRLNDLRVTELSVTLALTLDAREPERFGLPRERLWHDTGYLLPQRLAELALARGAEGLLVPSATRLGTNLISFPVNPQPISALRVVGSRDPRLYVRLP